MLKLLSLGTTHPSRLRRAPVSLRLGHARALTAHRAVIHYPRAASLPHKGRLGYGVLIVNASNNFCDDDWTGDFRIAPTGVCGKPCCTIVGTGGLAAARSRLGSDSRLRLSFTTSAPLRYLTREGFLFAKTACFALQILFAVAV